MAKRHEQKNLTIKSFFVEEDDDELPNSTGRLPRTDEDNP